MKAFIRTLVPLGVFAAGVVLAPGFAGAQVPDPTGMHATCAPVPQCISTEEAPAQVGDNADSHGVEYGYACLQDSSVSGWAVVDREQSGLSLGGCGNPGAHSGTTWYKPYGGAESDLPATGNFNHKYDNEENIVHCGGGFDDDCNGQVYEANSANDRTFYHDYGSGRGWIGFNFPRTASRSYCVIDAAAHHGALRNECYYVYG